MHLFPNYKTVSIPISGRNYTLYVADDFEKRRKGLANITFIPRNEGMLFKYDEPVCHAYTMEETQFPLKIMFFDADFNQVGSFDAKARQKEEVRPQSDFMYVIEILGR